MNKSQKGQEMMAEDLDTIERVHIPFLRKLLSRNESDRADMVKLHDAGKMFQEVGEAMHMAATAVDPTVCPEFAAASVELSSLFGITPDRSNN